MKKENITITAILIIVVALVIFAFSSFYQSGMFSSQKQLNVNLVESSLSETCLKSTGSWVDEFLECEGMQGTVCLATGGYFNACASACRHNPEATICTMQCVPVCEYAILNKKADLIRVNTPRPNQVIQVIDATAFVITGEARGTWFFEGSFPIEIRDLDNNVLFESFASAKGEWMTEEFVPYEVTLDLSQLIGRGPVQLILNKDNPSDLRELDDELVIPIVIK